MKKFLLALLAVAALAIVAVVIVENTPERRMDRRYDKLLRTYDEPEKLFQRVVDDGDLLGFVLVNAYYRTYRKQHWEQFHDFWDQFEAALCDCETAPLPSARRQLSWEYPVLFSRDLKLVFSGHRVVFLYHPEDCSLTRVSRDIEKTWGPYILRKTKEFREARVNR